MRARKSANGIIKQARNRSDIAKPVNFNIEKLGAEQINLATIEISEACAKVNELLTELETQQYHTDATQPEDVLYALIIQSANFPFNHQLAIIETASRHSFLKHLTEITAASPRLAYQPAGLTHPKTVSHEDVHKANAFKRC